MATEKLWTGFDNTKIMAERAVCDEVGQNIVDTYAPKSGVPSVYNAKLKLQLGSGQATDTGFTANASADVTLTVPEMTGATASTAGSSGIVPSPAVEDKDKFLKGDGTWDSPANPLPTPTHDNELFVGMSDGSSSWKQLTTVGGTSSQLLDDNDDPILDELGNVIYDNQPTLWGSLNNVGFYAERAEYAKQADKAAEDSLGQNIVATYQKRLGYSIWDSNWMLETLPDIGSATVWIVPNNKAVYGALNGNNRIWYLMCYLDGDDAANFAFEFSCIGEENSTVELYLKRGNTITKAYPSVTAGNTIEPGKYYQITCVGTCWTMAEFAP
jgi:hypothetical protein